MRRGLTAAALLCAALMCATLCSATAVSNGNATLPIVIWHGMGDSCCSPLSLEPLIKHIQEKLDGVYVHSIEIGKDQDDDRFNSFFMNVNEQLTDVCATLKADPQLAGGFNAIGFSQGGQFLRAYVQRCNDPPVHNLISVGGQHQGVFGLPRCSGASSELCEKARDLLQTGPYIEFIQDHLVQAEYWQDPFKHDEYVAKSVFLADINNEGATKNPLYKQRLTTLNQFVMVLFENDTMVQPRESEWFGFYTLGQDQAVTPMRNSTIYTEDWIGLQELDAQKRIQFLSTLGEHLQFTTEWFDANVVEPYLA